MFLTFRLRAFPIFILLSSFGFARAQDLVIDLYEDVPPYSTGISSEESWVDGRVSNVQIPQLYIYKPNQENNKRAVVIYCPGGGYSRLAMAGYGKGYAEYFNEMGITAVILKYRLPISENLTERDKVPITDGKQAIKLVRNMAEQLEIDSDKIIIMGSSAGGHLASMLSTQYDLGFSNSEDKLQSYSSKPNFSILIYPVISMDTAIAHMGSRRNLIGSNPEENLIKKYSSELNVTKHTPPSFIVHGSNDSSVSVINSVRYYEALLQNKIPVEMHVFQDGAHGSGLGKEEEAWSQWKVLCKKWIELNVL